MTEPFEPLSTDRAPETAQALTGTAGPASDASASPPEAATGQPVLHRLLSAAANPISWNLALGSGLLRNTSLLLLAGWLTFAGTRLAALLWRLHQIRRLKRGSCPPSAELHALFQSLRARLASNRNVELRVSAAHKSPVVLGFVHPVILLPDGETVGEAEPILRHELAHVRRRDDWANLVQHSIQAMFFVHPAVGWISKRLSLEREIACDDHVLQQSGRPRAYALLLANLAGRMQGGPPLLAPGVSANKSQLQQRIDMILNTTRNTSPRLAKTRLGFIASVAALLAIAAIYAAPRVVLAQSETPPPEVNVPAEVAISVTPEVAVTVDVAPVAEVSVPIPPEPPVTPAPGAVGAGPKPKPGPKAIWGASAERNLDACPTPAAVAPVPPVAAFSGPAHLPPTPPLAVIVAPNSPRTPAVTVAATQPPEPTPPTPPARPARPARAPRNGNSDEALEQRLDRLEKMLQSLMAQQNPKPSQDPFHWEWRTFQDGANSRKQAEKLAGPLKPQALVNPKELEQAKELARQHAMINPDELGKIKEYARRQADSAKRQAEVAQRQAEMAQREIAGAADQARQAAREAEKAMSADQKRQTQEKFKVGAQKKLEALHRQIEILERQREKLDRQIEQLEQDQEQLDEPGDEPGDDDKPRSELLPEQSKEKCIAQKSATG